MALIDEIVDLQKATLDALDATHNYFEHTKVAWRLIQQLERQGEVVTVENQLTGSVVDLTELAQRAQGYITLYLSTATFQDFVATFERFVFGFLAAWLKEFPDSLSRKEVKFRDVLDAADKEAIVAAIVEKEVQSLAYQRVRGWFEYVENVVNLGCPTVDQIESLAEIKATRDVLIHNGGVANTTYITKSGNRARYQTGELIDLSEDYHRESWQLIRQVVTDMANAAAGRLQSK